MRVFVSGGSRDLRKNLWSGHLAVLHCLASKDKDAYYVYLQELTKFSKQ